MEANPAWARENFQGCFLVGVFCLFVLFWVFWVCVYWTVLHHSFLLKSLLLCIFAEDTHEIPSSD